MSERTPKTPQEKKALSLARDRRNTYGNSDKAARKVIPLRKAKENRRNRHKNNQAIAQIERLDEARCDIIESSARQDVHRAGGWTKAQDTPLGEVIADDRQARIDRVGRKARSRVRQQGEPS